MQNFLEDTFNKVNDWLKYAEAKNGVHLALLGTSIFGVTSLYKDIFKPNYILNVFFYIYIGLAITSLIISLLSFLPVLIPKRLLRGKIKENDNLTFFEHIIKYKPKIYLEKIIDKYYQDEPKESIHKVHYQHLADQIIRNSKIAHRKFKIFSIALYITLTAIGSMILGIITVGVKSFFY